MRREKLEKLGEFAVILAISLSIAHCFLNPQPEPPSGDGLQPEPPMTTGGAGGSRGSGGSGGASGGRPQDAGSFADVSIGIDASRADAAADRGIDGADAEPDAHDDADVEPDAHDDADAEPDAHDDAPTDGTPPGDVNPDNASTDDAPTGDAADEENER